MNLWPGKLFAGALACLAWFSVPVLGRQAPLDSARGRPAQVEVDPIQCWWKADKNAVRVGELLTLTLTCGVIDTETVQVVVDPARLDPAVLNLAPFEVLDGNRHRDIPSPPRLYFQYSYTLRLIGDSFFGRDVDIPGLPLTYRVQSTAGDAAQGRDQVYLLPALPVRILSMVPVTATDIRDASPETFADLESRSSRATREFAAAGLLFAFAAMFAGVALLRAFRRPREQESPSGALLTAGAVFHACEREAQRIKSEVAAGWTPALVGRALTAFRIASAAALGRPVAQALVEKRERVNDGQLAVEKGHWRPQRMVISASTTGPAISGWLGADGREVDPRLRDALEDIAVPLRVFGAALYSRSGALDADALDSALERGIRGLDRLRSTTRWRARAGDALARTVAAFREARWAR